MNKIHLVKSKSPPGVKVETKPDVIPPAEYEEYISMMMHDYSREYKTKFIEQGVFIQGGYVGDLTTYDDGRINELFHKYLLGELRWGET